MPSCERRSCDGQYGVEYAGFRIECHSECHLYLWLFGMPKLGATGVAIATALSRLVELVACFIVSFLSKNVKLHPKYLFVHSKVLTQDFMRLSLPALCNDVSGVWRFPCIP